MSDELSASELRRRYLSKPGSTPDALSDAQLSASQLRARYGIQSNRHGEGSAGSGEKGTRGSKAGVVAAVAVLLLLLSAAAYFYFVVVAKGAGGGA
jgi:hypothetical protein